MQDGDADRIPITITGAVNDSKHLMALVSEKIRDIAVFVEGMKEAEKATLVPCVSSV